MTPRVALALASATGVIRALLGSFMKKQGAISIWVLCWAGAAFPAYPKNPSIIVDGRLDEAVWRSLPPERLTPSEAGVPSETGGEIRAIVIGRFLYIGARLPEPTGRITARLIGRNPSWEDEDLLRILCGSDIGYTDRILQINPWGAYSVEKALHVTSHFLDVYPYSQENPASQVIVKGGAKFLVATSIREHEWTVEAAIPLNELSAPRSDRVALARAWPCREDSGPSLELGRTPAPVPSSTGRKQGIAYPGWPDSSFAGTGKRLGRRRVAQCPHLEATSQ